MWAVFLDDRRWEPHSSAGRAGEQGHDVVEVGAPGWAGARERGYGAAVQFGVTQVGAVGEEGAMPGLRRGEAHLAKQVRCVADAVAGGPVQDGAGYGVVGAGRERRGDCVGLSDPGDTFDEQAEPSGGGVTAGGGWRPRLRAWTGGAG